MFWFPIRNHSHYSLLLATSKPDEIVAKAKELGLTSIGLTDFTTVAGAVSFIKECKKADIKPVIGCEIIVRSDDYPEHPTITLVCKNTKGWRTLLNIISRTNDPDNYLKNPTIVEDVLFKFDLSNLICIDGYEGSLFHYQLFNEIRDSYFLSDYDEIAEKCLHRDWESRGRIHVAKYMEKFGVDYYFESFPDSALSMLLGNCGKSIADQVGLKNILLNSPTYYIKKQDSADHRILLAAKLKATLSNLDVKIKEGDSFSLQKFITSSQFNLRILPETNRTETELLFKTVTESIECLEILSNPNLPKFDCPRETTEIEYLKHLCREGWKSRLAPSGVLVSPEKINLYKERVLEELGVIERANLAGYFLIVQDYVNEFRNKGVLIGAGRGSSCGSLVSFLTGITLVDPLLYNLLWSRFYNEGRNTKDHVSLPDIDVDFPPEYREEVIDYIKNKYGHDKVCQMITFGRMQGRSALKEVLRANQSCSFEEMNTITNKIPAEAAISDLLEEMDEPSVLRWALEHHKDELIDYCWIGESGELEGDYAKVFAQAMRLEGTFKTAGRHAAGLVISAESLDGVCPMVKAARSSEKIAGFEMSDVESVGGTKVDILGVSCLQKVSATCKEIE